MQTRLERAGGAGERAGGGWDAGLGVRQGGVVGERGLQPTLLSQGCTERPGIGPLVVLSLRLETQLRVSS